MFTILFVCTGNMCRSPMAELFARSELNRRLGPRASDFVLGSAGTGTMSGRAMEANSAAALQAEYGLAAAGFASTELRTELLRAADLILTAERSHRHRVVDLEPAVLKRSFTIREFGRVAPAVVASTADQLPADADGRARTVVRLTGRHRGTVRAASPTDDDIVDPIGRPAPVHHAVCRQIADAVDRSLTALVGA